MAATRHLESSGAKRMLQSNNLQVNAVYLPETAFRRAYPAQCAQSAARTHPTSHACTARAPERSAQRWLRPGKMPGRPAPGDRCATSREVNFGQVLRPPAEPVHEGRHPGYSNKFLELTCTTHLGCYSMRAACLRANKPSAILGDGCVMIPPSHSRNTVG